MVAVPRPGHVLSLGDLDPGSILALLHHAAELKAAPHRALPGASGPLAGRTIALLFQKPSLRTRVSFEAGIARLGGTPVVLSGAEIGFGEREPIEDMARSLERYVDAIVARLLRHEDLARMASVTRVPVVNALTSHEHPCQALADLLTLRERLGPLAGRRVAWVGDGNNVAHSLILGAASVGLHLRVATPPGHEPDAAVVDEALAIAAETGAQLELGHDPVAAVTGAQAVCTDVWTSMGQEAEAAQRRRTFAGLGFTVTRSLLRHTADAIVLHCLPAHRGEEVDADVIDGPASAVFDQAENRMWVQQALLLHLFARPSVDGHRAAGQLALPSLLPSVVS
ncbi:MAG: ornithine carbamoyltransferase [Chloroflexi bacterium]|nr:ornithine carbamoyltransferase [Chloroflexota bacterium]